MGHDVTKHWGPKSLVSVDPQTYWLVVDLPLWKIWMSDWIIIPTIGENKKCSKPTNSLLWAAWCSVIPAVFALGFRKKWCSVVFLSFFIFPLNQDGIPHFRTNAKITMDGYKKTIFILKIILTYTIYSEISLSPLPHGYGEFHWWEISTWVGELHIKGCNSPWQTRQTHATPSKITQNPLDTYILYNTHSNTV